MSTSTEQAGPTLDDVRGWPATVPVPLAATALGISRSHLSDLIRRNQAPVKVLVLGPRRKRVVTASLVRTLESGADAHGEARQAG
ncbi:DNA-binding protein [Streptomyces fagopyri]|uniref:DNA-binding protein n=1 Tax=Streptomyces fagopyri TaxID=2662397 RepID=UPI0036991232